MTEPIPAWGIGLIVFLCVAFVGYIFLATWLLIRFTMWLFGKPASAAKERPQPDAGKETR